MKLVNLLRFYSEINFLIQSFAIAGLVAAGKNKRKNKEFQAAFGVV